MAAYLSSVSTIDSFLSVSCMERGQHDYWNLDDILAEEECVPTKFLVDAKGLKYLDHLD